MLKEGDAVLYAGNGVCTVESIADIDFGSGKEKYLILKPAFDDKNTFYIPAGNENMMSKLRRLLSKREVDEIIVSMRENNAEWIDDEQTRKDEYSKIVSSADCKSLVRIIRMIYLHKKELGSNGKKLHICDEYMLKNAENLLSDEFAYVLKIDKNEVLSYILRMLGEDELK